MADDLDTSAVDDAALKAARQSEREIVSRYTGEFAWATVVLFVVLMLAYGASVALAVSGRIPLWLAVLVNVALAYGCYTVHHEANHGNISGRRRNMKWVDDLLGCTVAVPITLSFRGFAPLHLLHHAHTNDEERDPDFYVAGPARALPIKWLMQVVVVAIVRALPVVGPRMTASIIPVTDATTTEGRAIVKMRRFDQLALAALVAGVLPRVRLGGAGALVDAREAVRPRAHDDLPVAAPPPPHRDRPLPEHAGQRVHSEYANPPRAGPSPDAPPVPPGALVPVPPPVHRDAASPAEQQRADRGSSTRRGRPEDRLAVAGRTEKQKEGELSPRALFVMGATGALGLAPPARSVASSSLTPAGAAWQSVIADRRATPIEGFARLQPAVGGVSECR
jgi:hypothetical protein